MKRGVDIYTAFAQFCLTVILILSVVTLCNMHLYCPYVHLGHHACMVLDGRSMHGPIRKGFPGPMNEPDVCDSSLAEE